MQINLDPISTVVPGFDAANPEPEQLAAYGNYVRGVVLAALADDPAVLVVHSDGTKELATLYKGDPMYVRVPK